MGYSTNDVFRFDMVWIDSRFTGIFRNSLHFRVTGSAVTTAQVATMISSSTWGDYLVRVANQLCLHTHLDKIKMTNLTNLEEPVQEYQLGPTDLIGGIVENDDDVPQAAACITRRSFRRGRKAVGHYYFGPLPSIFTSEGKIIPDPTGPGDLGDVLDALGDPVISGGISFAARPIVCNAEGTDVVANNDVREQVLATNTVYLKSRRPNTGE